MSSKKFVILFLGADWWGSDARALAIAFRQSGHLVLEVNYEDFIPSQWTSLPLRSLRKACSPLLVREYNRAILQHLGNHAIDFMLVFKGKHFHRATLQQFCSSGLPAYCFYPDVSFLDHGRDIAQCLPLYECIFTTKSFHMADSTVRQEVKELHLVSHGFDPDVHRLTNMSEHVRNVYACDVSFVGCWSPKKEKILASLLQENPKLDVRIWGPGWNRSGAFIRNCWQRRGAYGDELCAIYRASKINLGLLSEAGGGTQVGDQVTARTWQIPAAGGFILHEHTSELEKYFVPGYEIGVFGSLAELVEKTRWFLQREQDRLNILEAGHRRCVEEGYTYRRASQEILSFHESRSESSCHRVANSVAPSSCPSFPERQKRPQHLAILYVGQLIKGSTTLQRLHALQSLGHIVVAVTTDKAYRNLAVNPSLIVRVRNKVMGLQDRVHANDNIRSEVQKRHFDLVWIDKGLTIRSDTLEAIRKKQPSCRIIGFSPDDMMNPANQSEGFLRGLPLYHCYVTNKSYNVEELRGLGCPNVIFMDNGFDLGTHRPVPITAEERAQIGGLVGFIGQWEPERAGSLRNLAKSGIPVRVWGYTWERMRDVPPGLRLENQPLWGDDYAKAICAFDINLCFLRRCNRDLQTTRSIEIPACGAFMLAERTDEHLRLFEEGTEADFFSSDDELIGKVEYYLNHSDERQIIAKRGLHRCRKNGYSYDDRLRLILQSILYEQSI